VSVFQRFQGPLFMVLATASYLTNDTMMKLATANLPPYEVLFLRGVSATIWAVPLLLVLGFFRAVPGMLKGSVLLRNGLELVAICSFILALTNMPIADATALGQITPLLVLVGASLLFGETLGWAKIVLIRAGLGGP
jgi:drug/metabolite transporter (DMT)-like permease